MTTATQDVTGKCLCGAVQFTAATKREVAACHCNMCRKWTAGPFLAIDCGDSVKVADDSAVAWYRSSDWAERAFCKQCGTSLFYRLVEQGGYYISVELLDDTSGFALTHQIFIEEKPAYYDFANKTENMTGAEVFAAFAQSETKPNG
jgi:hypothetical protein